MGLISGITFMSILLIILKLRVFDGSYKRWQSSYIHVILNGLREYSYTMGKHWAGFISCYISIIASFTGPSLPLREGGWGESVVPSLLGCL